MSNRPLTWVVVVAVKARKQMPSKRPAEKVKEKAATMIGVGGANALTIAARD